MIVLILRAACRLAEGQLAEKPAQNRDANRDVFQLKSRISRWSSPPAPGTVCMSILVEEFEGRDVVLLMPSQESLTVGVIETIQTLVETHPSRRVVLDLRLVRFVAAGDVGDNANWQASWRDLEQSLQATSRELVLCNLHEELAEALQATCCDRAVEP